MTELDRLIAELCPEGVNKTTLGTIGAFYGGLSGKTKEDFNNGNAKYITYMNVFSNLSVNTNINNYVFIEPEEKQNVIQVGDILFTGSSETPDECGMSSVLTHSIDEVLYLNSFCFGFRLYDKNILSPEFSKYLFRSDKVRKQIIKTASGVTRFNVSKRKMENVSIPLPPLPVQNEIVRILDNFTELTAELTAELMARKKQYEYYRNNLLSSDGEVLLLDDICQIVDCPHTSPKWKTKGVPVIRNYNLVSGRIDLSKMSYIDEDEYKERTKRITPQEDDILFSREAPIGNVGIILKNFICCQGQRVVLLRPDKGIVIPRFLLHALQGAEVTEQICRTEKIGSTVSNYNIGDLKRLRITIPAFPIQHYIVDKLDTFNDLCVDIVAGLPAEIEARRKQYEYYRDKLLTFKEVA